MDDAPVWALEALRGRETAARQGQGQGQGQGHTVDLSHAEVVGPLLIKHLIALHRKDEPYSWALETKRRVQLCQLHRFLRSACPQYQAECCLAPITVHAREDPLASATLTLDPAAGAPPSLQVAFVWHVESDGCLGPPGSDDSWSSEGSLEGTAAKDDAALLALAPPPPWVHLIAAVAPPQSPVELYAGVCPLVAAHDMQKAAQDLRLQSEARQGKNAEAPTAASLAKLVQNLQVLILHSLGRKPRGGSGLDDDAVARAVGDRPADARRLRELEALVDLTRGALVSEAMLVELIAEVYRNNSC